MGSFWRNAKSLFCVALFLCSSIAIEIINMIKMQEKILYSRGRKRRDLKSWPDEIILHSTGGKTFNIINFG